MTGRDDPFEQNPSHPYVINNSVTVAGSMSLWRYAG
jgi:hypothetical protein